MKKLQKLLVVLIAVLCWPILWAGNSDNLVVTSGSVLTSTADHAMAWTNTGITLSTTTVSDHLAFYPKGQIVYAKDETLKRYISVWIIDQDENVPLSQSILYEKSMIFTDKTPDEIRAGIPLLELLEAHNKTRLQLKNKEDKSLKKIRLRDLQIVIKNW